MNPVLTKPNAQQSSALAEIVDWFNNPAAARGYILAGFAGTGKTSTVEAIVRMLHAVGVHGIVLTAPTNKAVKVLRSLGAAAECCTIYSLLGLRMDQVEDTLRLVKADRDKCGRYRLVVLDEAGMANTELLSYIERAMADYGVRFLFVGDPKQLNPIGEKKSPIWGMYDSSVLTKVERHDNQILKFATHVRTTKLRDLRIVSDNDGAEGVWYESDSAFLARLRESAHAGEFNGKAKAIAWRNSTVAQLNAVIRQAIYADAASESRWLAGDRVVFTSPHTVNDLNITTDEEAVITDVVVADHVDYPVRCYYLTLKIETGRVITVKVAHEDSESEIDRLLRDYANQARLKGNGRLWGSYWQLRESFASIRHSYALTAHRAQGSTFDTVFVDVDDICSNSSKFEARRCLYVACTRAQRRLFLR